VRLRQDPPGPNIATPQHVAAGERMQELRERLERNDLAVALKTVECARALFRVLDASGVFQDSYVSDPYDHAYRAGRKSVGYQLWAAIDDVKDQAVLQLRADARARMRQELIEAESMRTPNTQEE
jgi:hypothetical protein